MQDSNLKNNFAMLERHYTSLLKTHDNTSELLYFFAPGRVNLIGEYTDFNGGLVLPCAIQYGTHLIVRRRADKHYRLNSINCDETASLTNEEFCKLTAKQSHYAWGNYPLGILKQFEDKLDSGFDFYYYGNIPIGSGLSSSASIELVTAFALNAILNTSYSLTELALLCQRAENQFIGVQCGIMDMYSIAHGKTNHALMINCENIQHQAIPLSLGELSWLIIDSKKTRKLSESKYNERNQECQTALQILNKTRQLTHLCQLPISELQQARTEIIDNVIYKRLHHVVSEHQRVIDCQKAMQNNNWNEVAKLMKQSHESLSNDFEVSGETLDTLVNISQKTKGVLGARMTGAGFGGCTVNLIESAQQTPIIESIKKTYFQETGLAAEFYIAKASQGVHQFIKEEAL